MKIKLENIPEFLKRGSLFNNINNNKDTYIEIVDFPVTENYYSDQNIIFIDKINFKSDDIVNSLDELKNYLCVYEFWGLEINSKLDINLDTNFINNISYSCIKFILSNEDIVINFLTNFLEEKEIKISKILLNKLITKFVNFEFNELIFYSESDSSKKISSKNILKINNSGSIIEFGFFICEHMDPYRSYNFTNLSNIENMLLSFYDHKDYTKNLLIVEYGYDITYGETGSSLMSNLLINEKKLENGKIEILVTLKNTIFNFISGKDYVNLNEYKIEVDVIDRYKLYNMLKKFKENIENF